MDTQARKKRKKTELIQLSSRSVHRSKTEIPRGQRVQIWLVRRTRSSTRTSGAGVSLGGGRSPTETRKNVVRPYVGRERNYYYQQTTEIITTKTRNATCELDKIAFNETALSDRVHSFARCGMPRHHHVCNKPFALVVI